MLNCADKTVIFGNLEEISDEVNDMKPLSAKEVRTSCKGGGAVEHWRALVIKKQQWRLKEMEGDEALCGSMELTQPKVREKTIVVLEYFIRVIISDFPQESEHING
ncbi:hypothetical protein Lal_00021980 [Lupinus albus]|nr:hypothetical protein Lal_00021980 [Lupinus albus]